MAKLPRIAVVIINWNNYPDTKECLLSLRKNDYSDYKAIVVDNGSTDGSARRLKGEFPECYFIFNKENEGFVKGSNIGFQYAMENDFDYVLTLNNDTSMEPNFLSELVDEAEKEFSIGIYSPKILDYYSRNIIDSTGHTFRFGVLVDRGHGKIDRGQYDNKTKIIGACAACALYRLKMLNEIGIFEEDYIMQYEDAELSWRAYSKGWRAKFVPQSIVYHKRGATKQRDREIFYHSEVLLNIQNVVRTVKKYASNIQKFFFILKLLKTIIFKAIKEKTGGSCGPYIKALRTLLRGKDF